MSSVSEPESHDLADPGIGPPIQPSKPTESTVSPLIVSTRENNSHSNNSTRRKRFRVPLPFLALVSSVSLIVALLYWVFSSDSQTDPLVYHETRKLDLLINVVERGNLGESEQRSHHLPGRRCRA